MAGGSSSDACSIRQPVHWPQYRRDWLVRAAISCPSALSAGSAIAVPCGLSAEGLPARPQIAPPRLANSLVLREAAVFLVVQPLQITQAH